MLPSSLYLLVELIDWSVHGQAALRVVDLPSSNSGSKQSIISRPDLASPSLHQEYQIQFFSILDLVSQLLPKVSSVFP